MGYLAVTRGDAAGCATWSAAIWHGPWSYEPGFSDALGYSRNRLILSTYMFPPIVAVIPVFIFAGKLGQVDKYPVLIIPYAAFNLPIAIWILRSSILQIPYEIQEAAMVDGAGQWRILRRVILPLLGPAIATVAILSAILSWNEFLFALSLTRSDAKTSPVGIQEFTGMFGTDP